MEATYNKKDIRISPDHLKTTQDLIVLRRGDEAIILDGILLRPLHIRRGANMVLDVATLQTDIKKHPALVDLLIDYGILKKKRKVTKGDPALPDFPFDKWQQLSLYLLLTHACNLSCVYCFNGDITYKRQRPPSMTKKIAEASIRWALKHLSPQGTLEIVFFGGEPLLKWPLIKWIINLCETKLKRERSDTHINYHLTSNLTILPKDLPSIATQIGMSFLCNVDGPKQIHDILRPRVSGYSSYNATVKTIRHLQSTGHNIALRSTITSQNVFRLSETVEHHAELGGKSSALVPLNPVSSDQIPLNKNLLANPKDLAYGLNIAYESGIYPPELLHPFSEAVERVRTCQPRRIACGAPTGCTPVVDAMGDIYPCIYFVGIEWLKIGNVLSEDKKKMQQVLSALSKRLDVNEIEGCRACALRYICSGGCPAMRVLTWQRECLREMKQFAIESSCAVARTVTEKLLWRLAT